MIVVIDNDLNYVKQYLEAIGKFEIYYKKDYHGPLHAYIYSETEQVEDFENMQNSLINLAHGEHSDIRHGVLMIRANHKTPKEIAQILMERLNLTIY